VRYISFVELELIIIDKSITKQNAPFTSSEPAKKKFKKYNDKYLKYDYFTG